MIAPEILHKKRTALLQFFAEKSKETELDSKPFVTDLYHLDISEVLFDYKTERRLFNVYAEVAEFPFDGFTKHADEYLTTDLLSISFHIDHNNIPEIAWRFFVAWVYEEISHLEAHKMIEEERKRISK